MFAGYAYNIIMSMSAYVVFVSTLLQTCFLILVISLNALFVFWAQKLLNPPRVVSLSAQLFVWGLKLNSRITFSFISSSLCAYISVRICPLSLLKAFKKNKIKMETCFIYNISTLR